MRESKYDPRFDSSSAFALLAPTMLPFLPLRLGTEAIRAMASIGPPIMPDLAVLGAELGLVTTPNRQFG